MRCLSSIFGNHSHIFPALVLNHIKASDQKHPYSFMFFEHVSYISRLLCCHRIKLYVKLESTYLVQDDHTPLLPRSTPSP